MEDPLASNVPLVNKNNSSSAVILPAQTHISSVQYRTCNNSNSTDTPTTTTTGIQEGADTINVKVEPILPLHQLQTLPIQKPNDLKQCNVNYG